MMRRLYRIALYLLPPGFRRRYGAELEAEAASRLGEARSTGGQLRLVLALSRDLVAAAAREWTDVVAYELRTGSGGGMGTDLRWASRALRRSPGFSFTVVATLAMGIGASAISLALVEAHLLRSLPYPEGERLVSVWPEENWSREMVDLAPQDFPSLGGFAASGGLTLVLSAGSEPQELFASEVTTSYFDVVGVPPALGRGFTPEDGLPGAEPVAVLSHRLWVESFGADPGILGRSIPMGGDGNQSRTVIGVMPEGYLPLQGRGVGAWVPVVVDPADGDYSDSYFMTGIGRLRTGATPSQARLDLAGFTQRMAAHNPAWFTPERVRRASALPLAAERSAERRTPVLAALTASLLVLLVACANIANLMVARTTGRQRELAVRAALGAGSLRTARAVLLEIAVLAALGTLGGVGVGWGLARGLERRFPAAVPDWGLRLDARWIAASVAMGVLAALVAGLLPGLQAARRDPARAMAGGRGAADGNELIRIQEALSAIQLALATAAISAMVLLGRSVVHLGDVDPGFEIEAALTFRVTAPPVDYPSDADVVRFFRDVRAALVDAPGVSVVGLTSRLPLAGGDSRISVTPEGWDFPEGTPEPEAWHRLVTPGYLEAMGVRLVEGRLPSPEDDRDGLPELTVINRTAARAFWPGESAVGKHFYGPGHEVWLTVAGVVDDVLENGPNAPTLPGLYIPHRDWPWRSMYAVARGTGGGTPDLEGLEAAVRTVSGGAPISRVHTLAEVEDQGVRGTRTLTILAAMAGLVTLLLGALGVYGVVNHAVARRRHEIGVRAALGAEPTQLLVGELARATRIVALGLPVGLLIAWGAGRALRSVLFGVEALDVTSFAVAVLVLLGIGYLAALVPARSAARVDPVRVMRGD